MKSSGGGGRNPIDSLTVIVLSLGFGYWYKRRIMVFTFSYDDYTLASLGYVKVLCVQHTLVNKITFGRNLV